MKVSQVFFVALLLAFIATTASAGVYDTVKICARVCSDGSTYTECIDTYGSASQGDCHERITCPSPLQNNGWAFDLGESQNLRFKELSTCQQTLNSLRNKPNLPVIVPQKYKPVFSPTEKKGPIQEAMEWHSDYSEYTDEEKLMLGQRIVVGNNKFRDLVFTEEEVRDIGHRMFNFVQEVKKVTTESGVYTNSKCAGCSLIVQSIQEKLTVGMCSTISEVITGTICKASSPVLSTFCNIVLSAGEVDTFLSTLCEGAFSKVINATNIRTRANVLCSTLTCLNQPTKIQSTTQITGQCKTYLVGSSARSLNERCDELIKACDMVEKGFCFASTIKELVSDTKEFVDASPATLGLLVIGNVKKAADNVIKLATECTGIKCGGQYSAARMTIPLGLLIAANIAAAIFF